MKKTLSAVLVLFFLLSLTGCQKKIEGTDGLIEKAREVILVADSDIIEMQYVGMHTKGNVMLAWFISGNEYQPIIICPWNVKSSAKMNTFLIVYTTLYQEAERMITFCNGKADILL